MSGQEVDASGFRRSAELLDRARRVDASFSGRTGLLPAEVLQGPRRPVFAERARGSRVWDVDGNEYIDLMLGFGSVILGHADARVTAAVSDELVSDLATTFHKPIQVRLCELLVDTIPNAEKVLLLRTGSDATDVAVRLARTYTSRDLALRWGYQGWHDWCAERRTGIPGEVQGRLTERFPYGDLDHLEHIFRERGDRVACIIMMPYEFTAPRAGYLQAVRSLAHRNGALFVLDEVRSGFRLAPGGAQEHFGVDADLVALSKAMANGYTISAVAGRAELMDLVPLLSVSSTFFRHTEAMSAAVATIETIREGGVVPTLWELGARVLKGLDEAVADAGLPARSVGLPPTPFLEFTTGDDELDRQAAWRFTSEALRLGVLVHPSHHWFLCAAMTLDEVDRTVEVLAQALRSTATRL